MPLFQYFGWVGSFLLAVLFAVSWWFSVSIAPTPASEHARSNRINIRIHTDQKWPERVVFDTTRSALPAEVDRRAEIGSSETPAWTERQPFEAFAEMSASFIRPCFRPPCAGQIAERHAPPTRTATPERSRSSMTARKVLTLSNPPRRPRGRS